MNSKIIKWCFYVESLAPPTAEISHSLSNNTDYRSTENRKYHEITDGYTMNALHINRLRTACQQNYTVMTFLSVETLAVKIQFPSPICKRLKPVVPK